MNLVISTFKPRRKTMSKKEFFLICLLGLGFGLGIGLGYSGETTWGAISFFATAIFCGAVVWKDL